MDVAATNLNDNLIYASPRIFERRRRILNATRELIAIYGYDGFSIRELCNRAGVAPQTVYKAFENKERLVALALREHFNSFVETRRFVHSKASLKGVIERLIFSDNNMKDMREFVLAIVAIYFSPTADIGLRAAAKTNIQLTLSAWANALAERKHLRPGLSPERFLEAIIGALFTVSLDWCRGDVSDDDFLCRKLEALLCYASGATRGDARREVDVYLTDLLGRQELIALLQAEAAQPPAKA